ncbi:MAG: gliding motility protein GldC [Saprospiraceae bacterium]|nr:gliding motility protein GldC [Saprospiraceae bacterium]
MPRSTEVNIKVQLGDDNIPERIHWTATESKDNSSANAKAILVSIFEEETKDTLKLDLWTKDMQVHEMDRFVYHTLRALSETYLRATNNNALANDMMNFAQYFGEKVEVIPPQSAS